MKTDVKNRLLWIAFTIIATLFLYDSVNAFLIDNTNEAIKNLLIAIVVEIVGILYLLPITKKEAKEAEED
ncbi:MAG: hypothetical protein IJC02_01155 [Lachnospiraceae bacterium]|nr:hypothetical protein [Tyzzerella sp.]MBQ3163138.1 hypothetical protein [Lachnospiraceae bacterium]